MPVALRTRMLEGNINILPTICCTKAKDTEINFKILHERENSGCYFYGKLFQDLLKSSFSFPNAAFFGDVLPWGDGFGSCEARRSVMVHAGGARRAPAQPAQLVAADEDETESGRSPKQPAETRQGAASCQPFWSSWFPSG